MVSLTFGITNEVRRLEEVEALVDVADGSGGFLKWIIYESEARILLQKTS